MSEVSLRDITTILWRYKWIIAITMIICIVVGLIYCLFIVTDSYEAEAVLMIQPIQDSKNINTIDTVTEIIEYLADNPSLSLEAYIEQIKLTPVLDSVADKLNIDKTNINYIKALKNRIFIDSPENSNLIYISFRDKISEKAILGANSIADSYIDYISETMKLQAKTAIEFISAQYEIENSNVEESLNVLSAFLAQPRGVDELKGELENSMDKINSYKSIIMDLEIDVAYHREGLSVAKTQIKDVPEFITVIKSVGEDAIITMNLLENPDYDYSDIADLVMVEQIPNVLYSDLASRIIDYEIQISMDGTKLESYSKTLLVLQKDIESLQAELALKQTESEMLYDKVNNAKSSRELYQNELKTAETKLVADIGKKSVIKIADAIDYEKVGMSKIVVMIISTLIGAVIGVILAFAVYSWKSDGRPRQENDNRVNES